MIGNLATYKGPRTTYLTPGTTYVVAGLHNHGSFMVHLTSREGSAVPGTYGLAMFEISPNPDQAIALLDGVKAILTRWWTLDTQEGPVLVGWKHDGQLCRGPLRTSPVLQVGAPLVSAGGTETGKNTLLRTENSLYQLHGAPDKGMAVTALEVMYGPHWQSEIVRQLWGARLSATAMPQAAAGPGRQDTYLDPSATTPEDHEVPTP